MKELIIIKRNFLLKSIFVELDIKKCKNVFFGKFHTFIFDDSSYSFTVAMESFLTHSYKNMCASQSIQTPYVFRSRREYI